MIHYLILEVYIKSIGVIIYIDVNYLVDERNVIEDIVSNLRIIYTYLKNFFI